MAGMRGDNVRRNGDREQGGLNYGAVEAAGRNTQAPRWLRKSNITLSDQLARIGGTEVLRHAPDMIARFLLAKLLILSWLPHPAPVLLGIAVCICLSTAVKGHNPGDMRYAGLRAILQGISFVLLCGRWVTGFTAGWENNAWWMIRWLPDFVRGWGDLDPALRAVLVDPFAMMLSIMWIYDTWVPAKVSAAMTGRNLWNSYREPTPKETPGNQGSSADLLCMMPFLFATLPTTTNDWIYALALGLGASFVVDLIIVIEVADILCVARQDVSRRSRHFAKYSSRRYIALEALGYALPRLLLLMPIGAAAIYLAGKDQWLSLLPLGVVVLGCTVLYPLHFGLSWQAVEIFETYPGGQPAKAGTHDVSEVVRNQATRQKLTMFAAYAWIPFVYGCVYHFLPGFPQLDGWAMRWPDLFVWNFLFASAVLCILPGQLVCGVLRACFGPTIGRFAR